MKGPILLAAWLHRHHCSNRRLALSLGCSRSLVGMWLKAERTPGLDLAHALERKTGIRSTRWLDKVSPSRRSAA